MNGQKSVIFQRKQSLMKTIAVILATDRTGKLHALFRSPKSETVTPNDHAQDYETCVPNISPRERLKRLIGGLIPFVIALAILTWLISANADRLWRLPLFILFVSAASGFFQWRDKTWVGLASRSSRNLTDNIEKIEDAAELAQVRRQARKVNIESFLAAIVLTLIALALPK